MQRLSISASQHSSTGVVDDSQYGWIAHDKSYIIQQLLDESEDCRGSEEANFRDHVLKMSN